MKNTRDDLKLTAARLDLFDAAAPNPNTNLTTSAAEGNDLSPEMKVFYARDLLQMTDAELVHDQFGQKKPIPKNGGKTIEFRMFDPLPELTVPLSEGVTPNGQSLDAKALTATVKQYGGYVTISDMLNLTAIDNALVEATKQIARQAGQTLDGVVREVLNSGTVVQYAQGQVTSRSALYYTSKTANCNLTAAAVKLAVRFLEEQDAPKIDGYYIGIIHPRCKYDLMDDPDWKKPHEYKDTVNIYRNEIGELYGVRFVQASRAKKFPGAGAKAKETDTAGADVYSTLILGSDAYGVTEIEGGGLEHIVKPVGSAGTADPLNQRSTCGWKATRVAEILIPQYIVRIETTATP